MTGTPTNGTYTLNGNTYSAASVGSVGGPVAVGNKVAPYLGIGYGNVSGAGVNFISIWASCSRVRPRLRLPEAVALH